MNTAKKLTVVGVALALGMSATANAAKQKEEDSVYKWGRWAVLSPAAGGEPYVATLEPQAENNARPSIYDEVQPKVEENNPVEIAGFCNAGSACGYATYSNNPDAGRVEAESVPEGFDLSKKSPDGPVLARFNLETFPAAGGEGQFQPTAVVGEGGQAGFQGARFQVFDTGNDAFPDIDSVDTDNGFGGSSFRGQGSAQTTDKVLFSDGSLDRTTVTRVSGLEKPDRFGGVASGQWSDGTDTVKQFISHDPDNSGFQFPKRFDFFRSGGSFVFGRAATLDAMDRFSAGNVQATYQGVVLDYNSAVTLNFDFRSDTFRGNFASGNGFSGFDIDGNVQGVNFAATDGAKAVTGSFFNAGSNASGAVTNGTQLGVFSADHVAP